MIIYEIKKDLKINNKYIILEIEEDNINSFIVYCNENNNNEDAAKQILLNKDNILKD